MKISGQNNFLKLLSLFILSTFVCAQSLDDMTSLYINHGKKRVIEKMISAIELRVQGEEFWHKFIEDINTTYGYFGSKKHLIIANKTDKNVQIYAIKNRNPILQKTLPSLYGSIGGDKQIEGDLKTPVGLYDFLAKLEKENGKLADKYGPYAFVTSYPNLMDKLIHKKTGHGIWLHGKPSTGEKLDTLGCVALDNDELSALAKKIDHKETIMVITQEQYATASKDELATLFANLYKWRYAWQESHFEEYISFYAPHFKRFDKKNLTQFSEYKKRIFRKKEDKDIVFSKINIMPYFDGENKKIFKINFAENYQSTTYKFHGVKNLYVTLENDAMRIIVEE